MRAVGASALKRAAASVPLRVLGWSACLDASGITTTSMRLVECSEPALIDLVRDLLEYEVVAEEETTRRPYEVPPLFPSRATKTALLLVCANA